MATYLPRDIPSREVLKPMPESRQEPQSLTWDGLYYKTTLVDVREQGNKPGLPSTFGHFWGPKTIYLVVPRPFY